MGDYDVDIPADIPSGEYQIRVGRFEDQELFGCSGTFDIVSDGVGEPDDMSLSYGF